METILQFQISEPPIKESAVFQAQGVEAQLSNVQKLKRGEESDPRIATFERNYWKLDGSFRFPQSGNIQGGYVSEKLSGEFGKFISTDGGKLIIQLAETRTIRSFTVGGSQATGDFVSRFEAKFFAGAQLVYQQEYETVEVVSTFSVAVNGADRIDLIPLETNRAYRRARITEIYFDDIVIFRGGEILRAQALKEASLTGAELPYGTFDGVLFSNDSMRFDVADSQSLFYQLRDRMRFKVYFESSAGREIIGTYYLTDWEAPTPNQLEIKSCDAIGLLEDIPYSGDYWMSPAAFDQAVKRVLRGEAAQIFPQVKVAAGFTPNPIQGYLKPSSTREALQQLLFAGGAWFRIEADGALTLTPQAIANTTIPPAFEFNEHNKALNHQYLKVQPDTTAIEVNVRSVFLEAGKSEVAKYPEGATGVQELTFKLPVLALEATGAEIENSEPFRCTVIPSGGKIIVKGHKTQEFITIRRSPTGSTAKLANVLEIKDATMITELNAETILTRLLIYAGQKFRQSWRAFNPPIKEVNQRVIVAALNGKQFNGVISKITMDLSGGGICDFEAAGFVGDYQASGMKRILFGAEGFVTPETFRYPSNTAQVFIAQLKSAYQDTNGINITIDGNLTRYMTSPVSFSLPSSTADTTVSVSFPTIVKAIQVQGGASCTPKQFKFPMSDAQYFIATRPNEYSFITIQINPGAGATGAIQRFDISSKPFTLTNTTEAMTVVVGTEYKPSRQGIVEGWYDPWPQYPSYGYPSLVWYYPVVGTQTLQVEAPVAYVPEPGNESDPMRYGVMDVAWYFNGQLVANHSGVSFSTLEIGNTTESTMIRAVVSNIRDTGSTGGGGSSSGGGYTPWEGVISQNGVLRDSPTNGNFIGSLWYHDKVRVIGEAAGTAVGGNSKWYNVTVLEAIPELVGVTGWVWSGNVGQS